MQRFVNTERKHRNGLDLPKLLKSANYEKYCDFRYQTVYTYNFNNTKELQPSADKAEAKVPLKQRMSLRDQLDTAYRCVESSETA